MSCLKENLTISSYGEGLETGRVRRVPRQFLTRQKRSDAVTRLPRIPAHCGAVGMAGCGELCHRTRRERMRARMIGRGEHVLPLSFEVRLGCNECAPVRRPEVENIN